MISPSDSIAATVRIRYYEEKEKEIALDIMSNNIN